MAIVSPLVKCAGLIIFLSLSKIIRAGYQMKQTENILQDVLMHLSLLKPKLQIAYPIKSLAVFGSVSRGEASPGSDIDILVEFDKPVGMDYIRLAIELENNLNR